MNELTDSMSGARSLVSEGPRPIPEGWVTLGTALISERVAPLSRLNSR